MHKLLKVLPDAMIVSGVCGIAYGASLIHPAAGFIAGGVLTVFFGVQAARGRVKVAE
jgi:hypothetical protein